MKSCSLFGVIKQQFPIFLLVIKASLSRVRASGRWVQKSVWTTGVWVVVVGVTDLQRCLTPSQPPDPPSSVWLVGRKTHSRRWHHGSPRAHQCPRAAPLRSDAMPRFTVHIRDEWLAVPCRDTSFTIQWLGLEALKRYIKNKPDNGGIKSVKETRFIVRRCQGSSLLDADDTIEDVLDDNDFVELGKVCAPEHNPTTLCA